MCRHLLLVFDRSENVLKLARPFRVIYSMHTHDVVEQRTTRRKEDVVQYFSRMVCMMSEGACFFFFLAVLKDSRACPSEIKASSSLQPVKYVRQSGKGDERNE